MCASDSSTTTGGLNQDGTQWESIFFHQATLMKMWRHRIIKLFRNTYQTKSLIIPKPVQKILNSTFTFNNFLDSLYKKQWIVHCSKPTNNHKQNVSYLGRYTKRPPIAESKLRHYDGNEVTFNYLDHVTKTYRQFTLTVEQFIGRFIQHIPDVNFRMIRYYGFLANRVRGTLLPIVYKLLGQGENIMHTIPLTYAQLMQRDFNVNPLTCILCGAQLALTSIHFGKTSTIQLLSIHRQLALLKKV